MPFLLDFCGYFLNSHCFSYFILGEIVRGHILYSSSDVPCDISYLEDFQLLGIVFETSMIVLDMSSEKVK